MMRQSFSFIRNNPILQKTVLAALIAMLVVAACTPAPTSTVVSTPPESTVVNTQSPTQAPSPTPAPPTPTPDPLAACPLPATGTALYVNREDGYCFLYPSNFTAEFDLNARGQPLVVRSQIPPSGEQNPGDAPVVSLMIDRTGLPDEMDSRSYAERYVQNFEQGMNPEIEDASFNGNPAAIVTSLSGMAPGRGGFVVGEHARYSLTIYPAPDSYPPGDELASSVWDTVTGTLTLFPPQQPLQVVQAEEVCLEETTGIKVFIHEADGYCFLYPDDFEADPEFLGRIVGGPVLGSVPDFGDVRTSLTLGTFGYFPDKEPSEVIPGADIIDLGTVTETTIGGYPAATYVHPGGPWASRHALILVDHFAYTIVAQPYEPSLWPAGIPDLDRLWEAVTGSLSFFTPWR